MISAKLMMQLEPVLNATLDMISSTELANSPPQTLLPLQISDARPGPMEFAQLVLKTLSLTQIMPVLL